MYNPKSRRTARQLLEEHEYLVEAAVMAQSIGKHGWLERPVRTVIDRAIRQQTESMRTIR